MEIKISTQQILKVLLVLAWLAFVGISINAGGYVTNTIYTLFINSEGAAFFWNKLDLSYLYNFSESYFVQFTIVLCIVSLLKAILFYQIIRVLTNNKVNYLQPFSEVLTKFIVISSYLCFAIGLFCGWATNLFEGFINKTIVMPDFQKLDIAGADVWFFISVILFVINQIFKRGIEIQNENDLTI